jgi:hypothetical protein
MRREAYGTGNDDRLVFVLGWGNSAAFDHVQWLIDRLVDAGYYVDVFEIPPHIADYESAWIDPVREFVGDLEAYRSLSHSTGGLISRFLPAANLVTRTYLSPWWGFHESSRGPLFEVVTRLPISSPLIPASIDLDELGELADAAQVEATPSRMAPTFLREARRAQAAMPPFDERDVVFYTPSDAIVGVEAIESQVPGSTRVAYDGGHELFGSACRDDLLEPVLDAIDGGVDGVDAVQD